MCRTPFKTQVRSTGFSREPSIFQLMAGLQTFKTSFEMPSRFIQDEYGVIFDHVLKRIADTHIRIRILIKLNAPEFASSCQCIADETIIDGYQ